MVELKLKSPDVSDPHTLFQRGSFLGSGFNPSLKKRGRGDFSSTMGAGIYAADFWERTLGSSSVVDIRQPSRT
jgi:hypothetical protein